jgi:hypothetical protein
MRQKIRRLRLEVVVHPINQARTTTSPYLCLRKLCTKRSSRLKLEVVDVKGYLSTTSIVMPEELPSVEEALKLFAVISGLSGTVLGIFVGQKAT